MNDLKELFRKIVGFSKTEANGTVVLVLLIVVCLALPSVYRSVFGMKYDQFESDQIILDSLVLALNVQEVVPQKPEIRLKPFNPNSASQDELLSVGIPQFLSRRIENFRNAGGSFKVKSDLASIYDFPDTLFQSLKAFIDLPEKIDKQVSVKDPARNKSVKRNSQARFISKEDRYNEPPLVVDINLADSTAFKKLYGIGSSYSKRLVSFRESLGGYHSVEQVRDMFGMTDSLYFQIKSFLTVSDTVTLKTLSINIATFKQLSSHPYINYELTKEILSAKSRFGKFKKPEHLYRLTLIDSATIQKLLPYLKF